MEDERVDVACGMAPRPLRHGVVLGKVGAILDVDKDDDSAAKKEAQEEANREQTE